MKKCTHWCVNVHLTILTYKIKCLSNSVKTLKAETTNQIFSLVASKLKDQNTTIKPIITSVFASALLYSDCGGKVGCAVDLATAAAGTGALGLLCSAWRLLTLRRWYRPSCATGDVLVSNACSPA